MITVQTENPNLKVSNKVFSGSKKRLPERLADDYEAILIVVPSAVFKLFKCTRWQSVPFLFVDEKSRIFQHSEKLYYGIDLRTENKDSALWSSYFGRFNKSEIIVVAANDRSKDRTTKSGKKYGIFKTLFQ